MPAGLLQPLDIPYTPWESMSLDLLGPLPTTAARHNMLLVCVCRLTKQVVLRPTTTTATAADTASIFLSAIFAEHGMPTSIVSDRDTRFTSAFWQYVMRTLGSHLAMSSPFHPQTDGQSERAIQHVQQILRAYVNEHLTDWDQHLPLIAFAINDSVQASTGHTPFHLNNGRHPITPSALVAAPDATTPSRQTAPATRFVATLQRSLALARQNIARAQHRQSANANKHRRQDLFSVGQQVLLSTHHLRLPSGPQHKLRAKFCGPFIITRVLSPVSVVLQLPPTIRIHPTVHISQLRPFDDTRSTTTPSPSPQANTSATGYYNMDHIAERRTLRRGRGTVEQVLVRWTNLQPKHDTWIPISWLNNPARLLAASAPDRS